MRKAKCWEEEEEVKKGPWTPEEDEKLIHYIQKHGPGKWRTLPKNAGLKRCGKSCRLRWTNYLRPDIKRGQFSPHEDDTIIQLHRLLGNKWSAIAAHLPGRTDNEIKNYWNTHIKKKLIRMGIDPITHCPKLNLLQLSSILNSVLFTPNNVSIDPSFNSMYLNPETTLLTDLSKSPLQNNVQTGSYQLQTGLNHRSAIDDPLILDHELVQLQTIGEYTGLNVQNMSQVNPLIETEGWNLGSMLSATPSSSSTQLNSSSTVYINGGSEDDRESYGTSDMLMFDHYHHNNHNDPVILS